MAVWIFGYASLLWKAGFDYDERVVGFIKGYRRTFHLACFEHRGSLDSPARVATLENDEGAICWGAAYCIRSTEAAVKAMAYLHVRESEYDLIKTLQFFTESSPDTPVVPEVIVFMSTLDEHQNKHYLGAAPKDEIAKQIATATGPSGRNSDYLFWLEVALHEIGHEDPEVTALADRVKEFMIEADTANNSNRSHGNYGILANNQPISSAEMHELLTVPVQPSASLLSPNLESKVIA